MIRVCGESSLLLGSQARPDLMIETPANQTRQPTPVERLPCERLWPGGAALSVRCKSNETPSTNFADRNVHRIFVARHAGCA